MIAIQTKYISPTNTRGSRIKAWTSTGFSATIPYPYADSYEIAHFQAVKEMIKKHNLDWNTDGMTFGGTEKGYVFCFKHSTVKEEV
jgi:hypothetical protein